MRIRSFIIAYVLVLALLLFADRRPVSPKQDRYSHVVDLTVTDLITSKPALSAAQGSGTRIIAPSALIPGTWSAGQIPPGRLIAPLAVLDLKSAGQITLNDIAGWEAKNGPIPQGSIVAIRGNSASSAAENVMPIDARAAGFLMDARYVLGFALESPADLASDRTLGRQIALHGDYIVERTTGMASLPAAGSLMIVAPEKRGNAATAAVRVMAMVR